MNFSFNFHHHGGGGGMPRQERLKIRFLRKVNSG